MAFTQSYMPDFCSINDILCTEERILCKFETDIPMLGYLDASSDSANIKAGAKVKIPLWLAEMLYDEQHIITIADIPNTYKEGYREILEADACAIVLSKWNPHYYELGMLLRELNDRDSEKMTKSLLQAFKSRFRLVMDWAQNPISDPTLAIQLPRMERDLFLSGNKVTVRLNEWIQSGTGTILTSEVAVSLKKRKRLEYELD